MRRLRVHEGGRFLQCDDGSPFFYIGDTAWELFHRLTREEAELYLKDRASKGFNVIQAVALAEKDGLHVGNAYGEKPLIDDDPLRPDEKYFQHVDWIVEKANSLGMHMGLLPTWGDKWNKKWGVGPEIFTPANARRYGRFLGERYKDAGIIWILGGDRPVESPDQLETLRRMADGLKDGDGGSHLIAFHPAGRRSSSEFAHGEAWLDFNTCQSGHHASSLLNYEFIRRDWALSPAKPCLDSEPCYEEHPMMTEKWERIEERRYDAHHVRRAAWWAALSGACGHTYGAHPIWMMHKRGMEPHNGVRMTWSEALSLPGASQLAHLSRLLLSRPFFTRVPDQSLIAEQPADPELQITASRCSDGSTAAAYLPEGSEIKIDMTNLSGAKTMAWWLNPRDGVSAPCGLFERKSETRRFQPPNSGKGLDWVLVLDDPSKGYPAP